MGTIKRTGRVWHIPTQERAKRVRKVCNILRQWYGFPRHNNPRTPLDDLIFLILTNRSSSESALHVFRELKSKIGSWDKVRTLPNDTLSRLLRPLGLHRKKSRQIRMLLRAIHREFGALSLFPLRKLSDDSIQEFLISLPGVSLKVAKCVMMYTLGRNVLPVDVHVHRVSKRLGWTNRKRADQCHEELEALIPSALRGGFHAAAISHGRDICVASKPKCHECRLTIFCDYFKRANI